MRIDIMTLFPEMCGRVLDESIIGRSRESGLVEINCVNIRDFSTDKHRRVDDTTYGGGTGMIMQCQPIFDCFGELEREIGSRPHLIYMSPQGKTLDQQRVKELGDYVLTGGELPALVLADSITRMLPGVLASDEAFEEESHYSGLLEYPQYTRPYEWHEKTVPDVLLTGHHANIMKWRREQSLERTKRRRPDLLKKAELSEKDMKYLQSLDNESKK